MRLGPYVRAVLRNGLGPSQWTGELCGSADGLSYLAPRSRRLGDFVEQLVSYMLGLLQFETLWSGAGSCQRCARRVSRSITSRRGGRKVQLSWAEV